MGRPRIFDEEAVLDAAVDCFWTRGYEATSTRTLAERMNLTVASLYNAFGDKKRLFALALRRYLDMAPRRRMAQLDASADAWKGLEAFFADLVKASVANSRGCMLINSAMEIGPFDPVLSREIQAGLGEIEAALLRAVRRAQDQGTLARNRDAAELAKLFLSTVIAVRVLSRTTSDRRLLGDTVTSALNAAKY